MNWQISVVIYELLFIISSLCAGNIFSGRKHEEFQSNIKQIAKLGATLAEDYNFYLEVVNSNKILKEKIDILKEFKGKNEEANVLLPYVAMDDLEKSNTKVLGSFRNLIQSFEDLINAKLELISEKYPSVVELNCDKLFQDLEQNYPKTYFENGNTHDRSDLDVLNLNYFWMLKFSNCCKRSEAADGYFEREMKLLDQFLKGEVELLYWKNLKGDDFINVESKSEGKGIDKDDQAKVKEKEAEKKLISDSENERDKARESRWGRLGRWWNTAYSFAKSTAYLANAIVNSLVEDTTEENNQRVQTSVEDMKTFYGIMFFYNYLVTIQSQMYFDTSKSIMGTFDNYRDFTQVKELYREFEEILSVQLENNFDKEIIVHSYWILRKAIEYWSENTAFDKKFYLSRILIEKVVAVASNSYNPYIKSLPEFTYIGTTDINILNGVEIFKNAFESIKGIKANVLAFLDGSLIDVNDLTKSSRRFFLDIYTSRTYSLGKAKSVCESIYAIKLDEESTVQVEAKKLNEFIHNVVRKYEKSMFQVQTKVFRGEQLVLTKLKEFMKMEISCLCDFQYTTFLITELFRLFGHEKSKIEIENHEMIKDFLNLNLFVDLFIKRMDIFSMVQENLENSFVVTYNLRNILRQKIWSFAILYCLLKHDDVTQDFAFLFDEDFDYLRYFNTVKSELDLKISEYHNRSEARYLSLNSAVEDNFEGVIDNFELQSFLATESTLVEKFIASAIYLTDNSYNLQSIKITLSDLFIFKKHLDIERKGADRFLDILMNSLKQISAERLAEKHTDEVPTNEESNTFEGKSREAELIKKVWKQTSSYLLWSESITKLYLYEWIDVKTSDFESSIVTEKVKKMNMEEIVNYVYSMETRRLEYIYFAQNGISKPISRRVLLRKAARIKLDQTKLLEYAVGVEKKKVAIKSPLLFYFLTDRADHKSVVIDTFVDLRVLEMWNLQNGIRGVNSAQQVEKWKFENIGLCETEPATWADGLQFLVKYEQIKLDALNLEVQLYKNMFEKEFSVEVNNNLLLKINSTLEESGLGHLNSFEVWERYIIDLKENFYRVKSEYETSKKNLSEIVKSKLEHVSTKSDLSQNLFNPWHKYLVSYKEYYEMLILFSSAVNKLDRYRKDSGSKFAENLEANKKAVWYGIVELASFLKETVAGKYVAEIDPKYQKFYVELRTQLTDHLLEPEDTEFFKERLFLYELTRRSKKKVLKESADSRK